MPIQLVLGFLFSEDLKTVVLLEKLKPAWQAGKLNGLGGKVEPGEHPDDAMRREFLEEGGLDISDWRGFARVTDTDNFNMHVYYATGNVLMAQTMETEKVSVVPVEAILLGESNAVGNLPFLIAMALGMLRQQDKMSFYTLYEENL
jgi:8-oxo-dGTP diphosphatase